MLKILQARFQQYMNHELPDIQVGFRKDRRYHSVRIYKISRFGGILSAALSQHHLEFEIAPLESHHLH